jgi:hypothetical protein
MNFESEKAEKTRANAARTRATQGVEPLSTKNLG